MDRQQSLDDTTDLYGDLAELEHSEDDTMPVDAIPDAMPVDEPAAT